MGEGNVTDQELADLVEQTAEAASALIRGDIRRYLTLTGILGRPRLRPGQRAFFEAMNR